MARLNFQNGMTMKNTEGKIVTLRPGFGFRCLRKSIVHNNQLAIQMGMGTYLLFFPFWCPSRHLGDTQRSRAIQTQLLRDVCGEAMRTVGDRNGSLDIACVGAYKSIFRTEDRLSTVCGHNLPYARMVLWGYETQLQVNRADKCALPQSKITFLSFHCCRAWKSVTFVRKTHAGVSRHASSVDSKMIISQRDMAVTQFGFIGWDFSLAFYVNSYL